MSIKISVEVEDSMKEHLKHHTEKFIEEVVLNAELSYREVAILCYLYKHRSPKDLWTIRRIFDNNLGYSTMYKAIRKLYILGLISRKKDENDYEFKYYVESDLPCRSVKNVARKTC